MTHKVTEDLKEIVFGKPKDIGFPKELGKEAETVLKEFGLSTDEQKAKTEPKSD